MSKKRSVPQKRPDVLRSALPGGPLEADPLAREVESPSGAAAPVEGALGEPEPATRSPMVLVLVIVIVPLALLVLISLAKRFL